MSFKRLLVTTRWGHMGRKLKGSGGEKKITQDMYYADEPEYYSAHNKEPLKSFKQGSNILRFTFFNWLVLYFWEQDLRGTMRNQNIQSEHSKPKAGDPMTRKGSDTGHSSDK